MASAKLSVNNSSNNTSKHFAVMLGSTRSASRGSAVCALPRLLLTVLLLMTSPCGGCREKIDLLLVIDSSGSIRDNNPADGSFDNWQLVKDFLRDLIATFDVGPVSIDDENAWPRTSRSTFVPGFYMVILLLYLLVY